MNTEEIIKLAREAGGYQFTSPPTDWDEGDFVISPEQLSKFATLVRNEALEALKAENEARPHGELIRELLDSRMPKSEREHAAVREIERLRGALEEVRRRSSIGVIDSSNRSELEVVLGDICLYVDAVLWQEYLLRDQEEDNA